MNTILSSLQFEVGLIQSVSNCENISNLRAIPDARDKNNEFPRGHLLALVGTS